MFNSLKLLNKIPKRYISTFKKGIEYCSKERKSNLTVPKILDTDQVNELCDLLINPPKDESDFLINQFDF